MVLFEVVILLIFFNVYTKSTPTIVCEITIIRNIIHFFFAYNNKSIVGLKMIKTKISMLGVHLQYTTYPLCKNLHDLGLNSFISFSTRVLVFFSIKLYFFSFGLIYIVSFLVLIFCLFIIEYKYLY